jgi:hypothetical protein
MLDALPASHLDGFDLLREAIVAQAAADLRGVLKGRKMAYPCSFSELRSFFLGEWGGLLLGALDGEMIFNRIVKECGGHGDHAGLRSGKARVAEEEPHARAVHG